MEPNQMREPPESPAPTSGTEQGLGNPQERRLTLEWAAGLIQGEGSIGFTLQRVKRGKVRITPVLSVGMNDHAAIAGLVEALRGAGLPSYVAPPRANGFLVMQVTGVKRLGAFRPLISLLRGDKRRALETVIAYCDLRLSKPHYAEFSQEEVGLVKISREINGGRGAKIDPVEVLRNQIHAQHQRDKTHCPHGHEYTPQNTTRSSNGARRCLTCKRSRILRD